MPDIIDQIMNAPRFTSPTNLPASFFRKLRDRFIVSSLEDVRAHHTQNRNSNYLRFSVDGVSYTMRYNFSETSRHDRDLDIPNGTDNGVNTRVLRQDSIEVIGGFRILVEYTYSIFKSYSKDGPTVIPDEQVLSYNMYPDEDVSKENAEHILIMLLFELSKDDV